MAQQVVESVIDKGVLKKVKTGNVSVFRPTIKIQTDKYLLDLFQMKIIKINWFWSVFERNFRIFWKFFFFPFSSLGNFSCYLKSFIGAIEFLKRF